MTTTIEQYTSQDILAFFHNNMQMVETLESAKQRLNAPSAENVDPTKLYSKQQITELSFAFNGYLRDAGQYCLFNMFDNKWPQSELFHRNRSTDQCSDGSPVTQFQTLFLELFW